MEAHLKTTYGFNEFREYQKDIIDDLLNGENVFAILPTGGGKSLLYQFPATYNNKITIVVSPLISLMNDQCMYLNSKKINSVCLNSETSIPISDYKKYKIIYATPEFITSRISLFDTIKDYIGLFAIDESHCVSQWSHDFRESYLSLGVIRKTYPNIPMLAVTATATPRVIEDIYDLLNIEEVNEYSLGTRRTNLSISVRPKHEYNTCVFTEPTIIYVQTRKICESLCEDLHNKGVTATYYHGGMSKQEKQNSHERFTKADVMVIVATISFGMGIDKSDIRHVINYGVTTDIETYYQEIGRAGRDGMPCRATMYYKPQDFSTVQFLIKQSSSDSQIKLKTDAMNKLRNYLNENTICRQQMIDYYFEKGKLPRINDVEHIPKCNMCDNCKCDESDGLTDISETSTIIIRLIDSHYKKNRYSYGVEKTADFLKKSSHAGLFTKTKSWLKEVLQILIGKNILKTVSGAGAGWGSTIQVRTLDITSHIPIMARIHSGIRKQKDNLSHIKTIRDEMASLHNCIPTVFMNEQVLMNVYVKKPKTLSDLWRVDGISQEFIMRYGSEFISKFISSKKKQRPIVTQMLSTEKSKDITKRLYNEGKQMKEICELTNKKIMTIEGHILDIFENDEDVDIAPDYFGLTEDIEEEIKKAIAKVGSTYLKPIKEEVNPNITYAQIKLCILIIKIT